MNLKAKKREIVGKKVKNLREEKLLPASVYGPKRESTSITIDPSVFHKVFEDAGTSKLIDMEIEGESKKSRVLIKEVQEDHLKDEYMHVSFYEVDPKAKITTDIPVIVEGTSPAVKNSIGVLVTPIYELEVRCLPADIPEDITINVSELTEIGDAISVSDIDLPKGVEFVNEDVVNASLAYIAPPQKEIVEEEPEEDEGEEVEGEEGSGEAEGTEGEAGEAKEEEKE